MRDENRAMDQVEFKANTCNWHPAWENACNQDNCWFWFGFPLVTKMVQTLPPIRVQL